MRGVKKQHLPAKLCATWSALRQTGRPLDLGRFARYWRAIAADALRPPDDSAASDR